jgi:membrane-associated phospholipid phosphatase
MTNVADRAAPAGAAFLSRLGSRVGTLFWVKMVSTAGSIALFFYAYFWAMRNPMSAATVMPLTWADGVVAFRPQAFPLYASLWVYISLGTALARDLRELATFGAASLGMVLAGLAVFMTLPTTIPHFPIDWSLYPVLQFMKSVDAGGNACPSLHAAFCVFTAVALHAQLTSLGATRWPLACNALWCLGILYSTMATRQHVALDVLAGVVLGGAAAAAYLGALAPRTEVARAPGG